MAEIRRNGPVEAGSRETNCRLHAVWTRNASVLYCAAQCCVSGISSGALVCALGGCMLCGGTEGSEPDRDRLRGARTEEAQRKEERRRFRKKGWGFC
eukprot:1443613-Rhodomonas_salina.2